MQKSDIKTVEDALIFITQVETERDNALKAAADAATVAEDAIEEANKAKADAPKSYETTIKNVGRVRVNFGVEGISKDDLLTNKEKIKALLDKGSAAVEVIEPGK